MVIKQVNGLNDLENDLKNRIKADIGNLSIDDIMRKYSLVSHKSLMLIFEQIDKENDIELNSLKKELGL